MKKIPLFIAVGIMMIFLLSSQASAVVQCPYVWKPSSSVATSSQIANGSWQYSYNLTNSSFTYYESAGPIPEESGCEGPGPVIVDWEIPYFANAGITSITSPAGWDYAIETIGTENQSTGWWGEAAWQDQSDPMYQGPNSPFTTVTQVLHWYNTEWANNLGGETSLYAGLGVGNSLSGFGFTAGYSSTNAPYQSSWLNEPILSGDPGYPMGVPVNSTLVPLPATALLLGTGFAGLIVLRRRQNKK